jgi:putative drug exporter of the RND superfamily
MCLRFVFLLVTRVAAWLRLSQREEAGCGRWPPRKRSCRAAVASWSKASRSRWWRGLGYSGVEAEIPLYIIEVGTAIAIGVLLDTLLVRTVLVPAALLTIKDAIWWPAKRNMNTPTGGATGALLAGAAEDQHQQ